MQAFGKKSRTWLSVYDTGLVIPATIIQGAKPGGALALSAGVHSREYVGIQALTELAELLSAQDISGTVTILHACNYEGFVQRSADVFAQDGKNLNRVFPGSVCGSITEQVAAFLEERIIRTHDFLVDLHSGGFCEALTPHVYFQGTARPEVSEMSERLARMTSVPYIVRSSAQEGFYSWAGQCGVPAIIIERGGCGLLKRSEVEADLADLLNILRGLGFLQDKTPHVVHSPYIIHRACYEHAPARGCWHPLKNPGDFIVQHELLGEIRDIYGECITEIRSGLSGVILYQTASLGIESNTPLIAYGELSEQQVRR